MHNVPTCNNIDERLTFCARRRITTNSDPSEIYLVSHFEKLFQNWAICK